MSAAAAVRSWSAEEVAGTRRRGDLERPDATAVGAAGAALDEVEAAAEGKERAGLAAAIWLPCCARFERRCTDARCYSMRASRFDVFQRRIWSGGDASAGEGRQR